jgi:GNAT superfamily N-acetyltransferase
MIEFFEESFSSLDDSWKEIFQEHYEEIAWNKDKIKLDPDYEKYRLLDSKGMLKVYTAREDGILIGYSVWFLVWHMHYKSTLKAMNDILYLKKEYRGGMLGVRLLQYSEEKLKGLGVHTIGLHIKKSFDWGKMAEKLGFEPIETMYDKWIGD